MLEFIEINFIALGLNNTLVNINKNQSSELISYILEKNKVKLLFIHSSYRYILEKIIHNNDNIKYIIWISSKDLKYINQSITDKINITYYNIIFGENKEYIPNFDKFKIISILYSMNNSHIRGSIITENIILNQIISSINIFDFNINTLIFDLNQNIDESNYWKIFTISYLNSKFIINYPNIEECNQIINKNKINTLLINNEIIDLLKEEIYDIDLNSIDKILIYAKNSKFKKKLLKNHCKYFFIQSIPEVYGNFIVNNSLIENIKINKDNIYVTGIKTKYNIKGVKPIYNIQIKNNKYFVKKPNINYYTLVDLLKPYNNYSIYLYKKKIVICYKNRDIITFLKKYEIFDKTNIIMRYINDLPEKANNGINDILIKTDYNKCYNNLINSLKNNCLIYNDIVSYLYSILCMYSYTYTCNINSICLKIINKLISKIYTDLNITIPHTNNDFKSINNYIKNYMNADNIIFNYNPLHKNKIFKNIIGIWFYSKNFDFKKSYYNFKNILKYNKNFNLFMNNDILYYENSGNYNINNIIKKYCNDLIPLKLLVINMANNQYIVFFIFNENLKDYIIRFINLFFFDNSDKYAINKYLINKTTFNEPIIKKKDKNIINYILSYAIIIYRYLKTFYNNTILIKKYINNPDLCNNNHFNFYNHTLSLVSITKIKKICLENNIRINSFFYTILFIAISINQPVSFFYINDSYNNIYIPNILCNSVKNFNDFSKKINKYLSIFYTNNINNIFDNNLIYKSFNDNKLDNLIFEAEYIDNFDILSENNGLINIKNIQYLKYTNSNSYNCSFKIYRNIENCLLTMNYNVILENHKEIFDSIKNILEKVVV